MRELLSYYWMVNLAASDESTLVCLSVHPPIGLLYCWSVSKFSQDWIISFF